MVIERVYNIPLRKGFKQVARYKKAKRAVSVLAEFLSKHMKQPDLSKVLIGNNLNKELWKHGIKNPPGQVKVVVIKEDNGDVKAELYGYKYEHKKKAEKEEKESKSDSKIAEKVKELRKKSAAAETKETHDHDHNEHAHTHEEKHEHAAGQAHEHATPVKQSVKKAPAKKAVKKAE